MRLLLIGSGGREHALALKLSQSVQCNALFIAPGNPGTAQCGTNVALDVSRHDDVIAFCKSEQIDLVIIGPEAPLVAGLVDDLEAAGLKAFGPTKAAAQLEGSKAFTKELCDDAHVPTAAYKRVTDAQAAKDYIRQQGAPIVVKADGLAAGKGVVVAETIEQAEAAVDMMFGGSLGEAGAELVIEECLIGEEASFFALVDGTHALALASAQDHKRVGDGDTGPNTGGMGAYSPAPIVDDAMTARVMREIILPTVEAMKRRGTPFRGVLFAGLMITKDGPKLIEYNTRFGDPECEVLMPRLESDLLDLILATIEGRLDHETPSWSREAALTVVMAAKGYPGTPETGSEIRNVENAASMNHVTVYHAGTARRDDGALVAKGGRVLAVTAQGATIADAQTCAYDAVRSIDWPGGFYRKDIGWRAI
ncbi:MAG: phosphoribosylamine--glycine ligase [Alphaproteobacteria bacterium]|nr:phosphoribosylamine--glycine ligase [Alphaproteobacteria bacterium]